jgi:hypothetical protein
MQTQRIDETALSLEISRRFDAPPERVFDAWLRTEWLPPGGSICKIDLIEPRVEGLSGHCRGDRRNMYGEIKSVEQRPHCGNQPPSASNFGRTVRRCGPVDEAKPAGRRKKSATSNLAKPVDRAVHEARRVRQECRRDVQTPSATH